MHVSKIHFLQIHRRIVAYGTGELGEVLNEPGVDGKGLIIRGRHFILIDNVLNSTVYHRMIGEMLMLKEFPLFYPDSTPPNDYIQKYTTNVRPFLWGTVCVKTTESLLLILRSGRFNYINYSIDIISI